ncbi:MAG: UDP-N-acetylenolpyruvoylglucosamine reductase [Candidatus Portnoybacteria bacterium CG10_big_fil_rev_8_21_14_0_10_36_7]|uniref:UDP-N-acetylenolpyruvoylglucosamine reductase n=1 Tax=Candidatus Portnoybacteria bacterium CG10_big_fil_rev_8_21_14_0_10_36_7 TaxID=1974812 RepID=A0A2M8KDC6_9BACT|nr:MAG: UDP-N-acetylenolpyruvoylglucosamine reductase [Candidatus Portnoybacteria bacterium CG10_big_fil_rev_8_21_14_0_10_36_7]
MSENNFEQNIVLANFTTWRIGGPAKFFLRAKTIEDIKHAVAWSTEKNMQYFILGGGSNLLVNDDGLDGLVIKVQNDSLEIIDEGDTKLLKIGAGALLSKVFVSAKCDGLIGLEWAFGIPGTVGGAVCGNAGAYGENIGMLVESIDILRSGESIELSSEECQFSYRSSKFKSVDNQDIVISVKLRLKKEEQSKIDEAVKSVMSSRQGRHPHEPSAGSVFKNIELKNYPEEFQKLIPANKIKSGFLATAYLIDECGLKGKQIGQIKVSDIHANYLVNLGGGKASDVKKLIEVIRSSVKEKFGIIINEEIVFL